MRPIPVFLVLLAVATFSLSENITERAKRELVAKCDNGDSDETNRDDSDIQGPGCRHNDQAPCDRADCTHGPKDCAAIYDALRYVSPVIRDIFGVSRGSCCSFCRSTAGCNCWTWAQSHHCTLHAVCEEEHLSTSIQHISGLPKSGRGDSVVADTAWVLDGREAMGEVLEKFSNVGSLKKCGDKCRDTPRCSTYEHEGGTCSVYYADAGEVVAGDASVAFLSTVHTKDCDPQYNAIYDDFSNDNLLWRAIHMTPPECCQWCRQQDGCARYLWGYDQVYDYTYCFTFTANPAARTIRFDGVVSGTVEPECPLPEPKRPTCPDFEIESGCLLPTAPAKYYTVDSPNEGYFSGTNLRLHCKPGFTPISQCYVENGNNYFDYSANNIEDTDIRCLNDGSWYDFSCPRSNLSFGCSFTADPVKSSRIIVDTSMTIFTWVDVTDEEIFAIAENGDLYCSTFDDVHFWIKLTRPAPLESLSAGAKTLWAIEKGGRTIYARQRGVGCDNTFPWLIIDDFASGTPADNVHFQVAASLNSPLDVVWALGKPELGPNVWYRTGINATYLFGTDWIKLKGTDILRYIDVGPAGCFGIYYNGSNDYQAVYKLGTINTATVVGFQKENEKAFAPIREFCFEDDNREVNVKERTKNFPSFGENIYCPLMISITVGDCLVLGISIDNQMYAIQTWPYLGIWQKHLFPPGPANNIISISPKAAFAEVSANGFIYTQSPTATCPSTYKTSGCEVRTTIRRTLSQSSNACGIGGLCQCIKDCHDLLGSQYIGAECDQDRRCNCRYVNIDCPNPPPAEQVPCWCFYAEDFFLVVDSSPQTSQSLLKKQEAIMSRIVDAFYIELKVHISLSAYAPFTFYTPGSAMDFPQRNAILNDALRTGFDISQGDRNFEEVFDTIKNKLLDPIYKDSWTYPQIVIMFVNGPDKGDQQNAKDEAEKLRKLATIIFVVIQDGLPQSEIDHLEAMAGNSVSTRQDLVLDCSDFGDSFVEECSAKILNRLCGYDAPLPITAGHE